jgi:tetratricopeptide (TPR) repeat protein
MIAILDAKQAASASGTNPAVVTHGTIALRNLAAQIEGLERNSRPGLPRVEERVRLIDLLALRGSILGSIADYEGALELAHLLVRQATTEAVAYLARARTRAVFHRFGDALDDLDVAERLAADTESVDRERAAVFQGLGRYEEARTIREEDARRCPSFESLGALTTLCAERGDTERAERLHAESVRRYRDVSPLPLATLDFQLGVMWMHEGQLDRAQDHLIAARRYVPAYAPAQGHFAEVEAELGKFDLAIALLNPLAATLDDPDYAAQLARIYADAGYPDDSRYWRNRAAARYDEIIAVHPEAFADHAAEFWLGVGGDPNKALRLATLNFEVRRTPRGRELLHQAVLATNSRKQDFYPCPSATTRGSNSITTAVIENERTAMSQNVTHQPDGPGKRIGKKGEISGIGKDAPRRSKAVP